MSWSLFKKCVDEASLLGVNEICLHFGGESLLPPEFKEYLKYVVIIEIKVVFRVSWIEWYAVQ